MIFCHIQWKLNGVNVTFCQGRQLIENDKKIKSFIWRHIDQHRLTFNPDNIRDLLDLYLKVNENRGETDSLSGN